MTANSCFSRSCWAIKFAISCDCSTECSVEPHNGHSEPDSNFARYLASSPSCAINKVKRSSDVSFSLYRSTSTSRSFDSLSACWTLVWWACVLTPSCCCAFKKPRLISNNEWVLRFQNSNISFWASNAVSLVFACSASHCCLVLFSASTNSARAWSCDALVCCAFLITASWASNAV